MKVASYIGSLLRFIHACFGNNQFCVWPPCPTAAKVCCFCWFACCHHWLAIPIFSTCFSSTLQNMTAAKEAIGHLAS